VELFRMNRARWRMAAGFLATYTIAYGLPAAGMHWLLLGTPAWWTTPAGLIGIGTAVMFAPFYSPRDTRWFLARWRAAGAGDPMPARGPDLPNPWWVSGVRLTALALVVLLIPAYAVSLWLYMGDMAWMHGVPWLTLVVTVPAYVWLVVRYRQRQARLRREREARAARVPFSITFGPEARMFVNGQEIAGREITVHGHTDVFETRARERLLGLRDVSLDMLGTVDSDAAGVFEAWPLRSRDSQPPAPPASNDDNNDDGEKGSGRS
jgi:hypothetical protein